jgi:hypothetical protein
MRTMSLAILAGVLVYGLPSSASAQGSESRLCPPGQIMQGGVCAPRPRMGRGPGNPGAGEGWNPKLPGYESMVCEWQSGPDYGTYFFCPADGKTNPKPKL